MIRSLLSAAVVLVAGPLAVVSVLLYLAFLHRDDRPVDFGGY